MITDILIPLICPRFLSDERYRNGHIRIINALPERRILGLHVPEMKKTAKLLAAREDAANLLREFEKAFRTNRFSLYYEETVVWGLTINAMKCNNKERLHFIRSYLPVIDNWGVCDTFCCNTKWASKMPHDELWSFLSPYFDSHSEFEVRFAVVMSMCHLLNPEWLPRVFARLESIKFDSIQSEYTALKNPPYYVRMAVAWLLATSLAKFPEATRKFVRSSSLPDDVKRLYVRKARESFRTRNTAPF